MVLFKSNKMNPCFVALEGFQMGKTLIVKELHLLADQGEDHKHFMFLLLSNSALKTREPFVTLLDIYMVSTGMRETEL